ncbi:hypothetical protein [Flavobacterium ustbae]|uniref:hypothetical protein n=1 Tax=Flavobacterium ustbae TaxID=2488790 RepID=UPI000F7A03B1|nr:hypothetical protein [Flavobacterium ustbae]
MSSELKVKIKRSLLDNYKRDLHLHSDFIRFEDKDLANNGFTLFKVNEIKEFRYGITYYQYKFVFGREYQLYVRNFNNEILKINFNTYLGIKKHECHEIYVNILNALWNLYFEEKTLSFIEKFKRGESFFIGDVHINSEGVILEISKLLKQEKKLIPWNDVAIKKYNTYVSVYSKENSLNFNRGYSYKNDWNTFVLYSVINNIIENKNTSND